MSPPNDESGVNSATEVIGADVEIFVAVVFSETVITPRSAFVVGAVVAVKVAVVGKTVTKGARRQRCSSGTGVSGLTARRRLAELPARVRDG